MQSFKPTEAQMLTALGIRMALHRRWQLSTSSKQVIK
jgi:hypothetical protein